MAVEDVRLPNLDSELTTLATDDYLYITDKSDTTHHATGTSKWFSTQTLADWLESLTQTLTNKTLTAPVISTIVNTGTLTLPTDTDTLVGRDTTDTLTNKTLTSPTITTPAIGVATGTSLDLGSTTLLASRALTIDTGGVFNIVLASAAGDDFTVDTDKLVVSGDTGFVGISTAAPAIDLDVLGAIGTRTYTTCTSSSDAFDVTNVSVLICNTSSGAITLGGLSGGVDGQVLFIFKGSNANNLVIESLEGTGTQKFLTAGSTDITLGKSYSGLIAWCLSDFWRVVNL